MLRAEILRGGVGGLGVPSHAQRPARTNCDVHGQLCGSHRLCYGNTRSVDQISDPMTAARQSWRGRREARFLFKAWGTESTALPGRLRLTEIPIGRRLPIAVR